MNWKRVVSPQGDSILPAGGPNDRLQTPRTDMPPYFRSNLPSIPIGRQQERPQRKLAGARKSTRRYIDSQRQATSRSNRSRSARKIREGSLVRLEYQAAHSQYRG